MVKNGVIIGHYDGNKVKESWDGKKYDARASNDYQMELAIGRAKEKLKETKRVPEFFEDEKKEVRTYECSTVGETVKETEVNFDTKMDWASYSSVVDEFFANLKDFESWKV